MPNDNTDERYFVSDEAIFDSFFLLIKEKDIDRITVSDVIKKAGIVRSTFYNHYENIPALIDAIEDKTINDIFRIMESFHPKDDVQICRQYFLTICNYTMSNPFFASRISSPHSDAFFKKILTMLHRYVTEVTKTTVVVQTDSEEFSYVVASAIGSTIGVLHKWTREEFKVPAEVIANLLTKTFISGMLPFMK